VKYKKYGNGVKSHAIPEAIKRKHEKSKQKLVVLRDMIESIIIYFRLALG